MAERIIGPYRFGILPDCLFLGCAEYTPYPIVSTTSSLLLNKTPEIIDLAAESISSYWIALKGWIADWLFCLTSATFTMVCIWYAYLKIPEFLCAKTAHSNGEDPRKSPDAIRSGPRPLVFGQPGKRVRPPGTQPTVPRFVSISYEEIDSSATSGQSGDEVGPSRDWAPAVPSGDQCRPNQLFLGSECANALTDKRCVAKYMHVTKATLCDQMLDTRGAPVHAEGRIRLRDNRFAKYRTYNAESHPRELGFRERRFLIPCDDILILVFQRHAEEVPRTSNKSRKCLQLDVFVRDSSWNYVRMDADERLIPGNSIGAGVGLPHREKLWGDRGMDNRLPSGEHRQPRLPAEFEEEFDDSPTGDELRRTARPRVSQRSAPETTHARNRPEKSRVSIDSAPDRQQYPARINQKLGLGPPYDSSSTIDSEGDKPIIRARRHNPKDSRPRMGPQSFMQYSGIYGAEAPIPICRGLRPRSQRSAELI